MRTSNSLKCAAVFVVLATAAPTCPLKEGYCDGVDRAYQDYLQAKAHERGCEGEPSWCTSLQAPNMTLQDACQRLKDEQSKAPRCVQRIIAEQVAAVCAEVGVTAAP
jgi:hypothetical protein